MGQQTIKTFLKEFSTKEINGTIIDKLKSDMNNASDDNLFSQLKNEFSKENQAFGIWVVVKTCIQNIGCAETPSLYQSP